MFIFTIILMVSLSLVLYLAVQALPRIAEEPEGAPRGESWWVRSRVSEKMDAALNNFLLKFLRRVKVTVLKIDNTVSAHMEKVKPEGSGKKPAIDFKEIAGQNKDSQNGSA